MNGTRTMIRIERFRRIVLEFNFAPVAAIVKIRSESNWDIPCGCR